MSESPFFEFPADTADFEKYLAGISAKGGGDIEWRDIISIIAGAL